MSIWNKIALPAISVMTVNCLGKADEASSMCRSRLWRQSCLHSDYDEKHEQ